MARAGRRGLTASAPLLVLALCLLAPLAARADIVLHDGGVSKDRDASARVKARTGSSPTLVLSSDILAGPTRVLLSYVRVERCEGKPVSLSAEKRLDAVTDKVLSFELDAAVDSLSVLDTLLPCSEAPVSARQLARTSFLRGAARFDQGDELGAAEAMTEAAAFDPEYDGERGFPKAHIALLRRMREQVAGDRPGKLYVWPSPDMSEVLVDGKPVKDSRTKGETLPGGLHLLQISTPHGLTGMWVHLTGRASTIVFPAAGRRVWADGGRSPGGEQAMGLLLQDEFGGREGDIHLIHYRGRTPAGATFPGDGGRRIAWTSGGDRKTDRSGGKKPDRSGGKKPDRTSDKKPDRTADKKPDRTTDKKPDRTTDKKPDRTTDKKPDRTADKKPDRTTDKKPDRTTDKEPDRTADKEPDRTADKTDGGKKPDKTDGGETTDKTDGGSGGDRTADRRDPDKDPSGRRDPDRRDPGKSPADRRDPTRDPDERDPDRRTDDGDTGRTNAGDGGSGGTTTRPGGGSTAPTGKLRRFRVAVGFGYQHAAPFDYAMLSVDFSAVFWGPLQAAAFIRPSYGGPATFPVSEGESEITGPVFFVPMGVSIGVRKDGWVSPWVNAGFQYAYNRDGLRAAASMFGVVLQGGLDLSPLDGPLIIRIQGELGNIGVHFNGRISIGAGVRF